MILHSRYLSWAASGENRVVDDEARLLAEGGHEVDRWEVPFSTSGPGLIQSGVGAIWSSTAVAEVRRRVRSFRPDVVHFHNLFPKLSPAAVRAAEDEGVAVTMTLHNYRLMCLPGTLRRAGAPCELCVGKVPWRGVAYRCLRDSALGSGALAASLVVHRALDTFSRITLCLAVSEFVASKHVEAGLPAEQVRVKRNFSWEMPRRRAPGEFFLYLGRLSPEKGVGTLLEACRRSAFPLVIAGDGQEADALRAAAPEGVDFRGAIPPS
ncbi:MAG: glycosyltransferase, partial [Actinomycetota bacterium]